MGWAPVLWETLLWVLEAAHSLGCEWTQVLGGKRAELAGPSPRPLSPYRVFFDSCDGFFTNYNWQEEHLERMRGQAGERQTDVYVGVDVFARGNVVGGRFDTNKVGGGTGVGGGDSGLRAFHGAYISCGPFIPILL